MHIIPVGECIKNFILAILIILILHILLKGQIIDNMTTEVHDIKRTTEKFQAEYISPKFFRSTRVKSKDIIREPQSSDNSIATNNNCELVQEQTILDKCVPQLDKEIAEIESNKSNDINDLYKFVFEGENKFDNKNNEANSDIAINEVAEINNHVLKDNNIFNDVSGFDDNVMQTYFSSI